MMELKSKEVVHQLIYVSEFSPTEYFIPLKIEYDTESGKSKLMIIPISIDISKFMIKEKPLYAQNYRSDYKSHQHVTLKNKTELTFYPEGENRVARYSILNDMERWEIREDLCEPGYNMQVLSTFLDSQGSKVRYLVEYLKFMYD